MNPYMTSFTLMGVIYLGLVLWSLVVWLPASLAISVFGVAICALGWKASETYLQ
jgi:hypothetical protein